MVSLVYMPSGKYSGVEIFSLNLFKGLRQADKDGVIFVANAGPLTDKVKEEYPNYSHLGTIADILALIGRIGVTHVFLPSQSIGDGTFLVKKFSPEVKVTVTAHGAVPVGWSYRSCDLVVNCAQWLKVRSDKLLHHETNYIYNGVETSFQYKNMPIKTPPILVWAGRVRDPMKRFSMFLEIVSRIDYGLVDVWVCSPDSVSSLPPSLLEQVLKYNPRWLSPEPTEMSSIFQQVAASGGYLLMTSAREGLPRVAIEAQACGCPVIGPGHTGILEAALNKNLLYSPDADAGSVAEFIVRTVMQEHEVKSEVLSSGAREKFSLEKMPRCYADMRIKEKIHLPIATGFLTLLKAWRRNGFHVRLLISIRVFFQAPSTCH